MKARIDAVGRIMIPKHWREALGFAPGSEVDISPYGGGLAVLPGGRTARIVRNEDGLPVATGTTVITDEIMYTLIDAGRK